MESSSHMIIVCTSIAQPQIHINDMIRLGDWRALIFILPTPPTMHHYLSISVQFALLLESIKSTFRWTFLPLQQLHRSWPWWVWCVEKHSNTFLPTMPPTKTVQHFHFLCGVIKGDNGLDLPSNTPGWTYHIDRGSLVQWRVAKWTTPPHTLHLWLTLSQPIRQVVRNSRYNRFRLSSLLY